MVSASLNVTGVTCNPDPSRLNSVVNAPVVELLDTTSNPSSDLTGPEKVVLAITVPSYERFRPEVFVNVCWVSRQDYQSQ